jgi:pimeloyl-ACP methyl ester carboxylesterase
LVNTRLPGRARAGTAAGEIADVETKGVKGLIRNLARLGALTLVGAAACTGAPVPHAAPPSALDTPAIQLADVGGYRLAYECAGSGSPAVILEAGYTASGIDTYGETILPEIAKHTRVCTYDRAGDGLSDARPAPVRPLTGGTQAKELHAMLAAAGVAPPYVVVGHSYGGMVAREFARLYPAAVAGMVLLDASSEPEIPVYERLHAGAWIDGTVEPGPNQRLDMHATVRELQSSPSLGDTPLIVVTAGILEDKWLSTVPVLASRAQTRLVGLSSNSIHVLDRGEGHFIPHNDPGTVIRAALAVVAAARAGEALSSCASVFGSDPGIECLQPGQVAKLRVGS